MTQDKGRILNWRKQPGEPVTKGDPIMEVETDKAVEEIEAPATGILGRILAQAGEDVPVTQVVAIIFSLEEYELEKAGKQNQAEPALQAGTIVLEEKNPSAQNAEIVGKPAEPLSISAVAARIATDNQLDLRKVKPQGGRINKADVLAYLAQSPSAVKSGEPQGQKEGSLETRRLMASPKARRMAAELGVSLSSLNGSGPSGAVLAADVMTRAAMDSAVGKMGQALETEKAAPDVGAISLSSGPALPNTAMPGATALGMSQTWQVMVESMTHAWTTVPHFYLLREVNASRMVTWRQQAQEHSNGQITFTDIFVKVVAEALKKHPRINSSWENGQIWQQNEVNIGLAVAIDGGLVVPVIHHADQLCLNEIATARKDLVARAKQGKLHLQDIRNGTFTITNLGMYGVDCFNAVINAPQAAILATGRIAERVVPLNGIPAIQPVLMLSLSCDHRVVDGARGAQFLDTLSGYMEEPLKIME
jgi:pyruvate dehydrogenase E2 component (dihydrolipoamide acetyltransferase)